MVGDVAFQLDPELKDWLGSYKRAHVMRSFAPTCILFTNDLVQTKTIDNASIDSIPTELRHLRHGIFCVSCLKQRVSLAVPRWKRVTSARKKGDDPKTDL